MEPSPAAISTLAPQTDLSAKTTAASRYAGCVMETTTVAMMRTNPTPPALVHTDSEFLCQTPEVQSTLRAGQVQREMLVLRRLGAGA
uniref:Uncharacterized protein n=1 Tax=Oryzias latipes TaxID=8090 RepID=A0A3P9L550_ORYLA